MTEEKVKKNVVYKTPDVKSKPNFKKIFAKLKFSPVLFQKIPSFVCLVFKIEDK